MAKIVNAVVRTRIDSLAGICTCGSAIIKGTEEYLNDTMVCQGCYYSDFGTVNRLKIQQIDPTIIKKYAYTHPE